MEWMNEWNGNDLSQNTCCKKQKTCSRWAPIATVHDKFSVTEWNFLSDSTTKEKYGTYAKYILQPTQRNTLKNQRKNFVSEKDFV